DCRHARHHCCPEQLHDRPPPKLTHHICLRRSATRREPSVRCRIRPTDRREPEERFGVVRNVCHAAADAYSWTFCGCTMCGSAEPSGRAECENWLPLRPVSTVLVGGAVGSIPRGALSGSTTAVAAHGRHQLSTKNVILRQRIRC